MADKLLFAPPSPAGVPIEGITPRFAVGRIFCVGRNYHAHAAEMGFSIDKTQQEPFYFTKHPSAITPSGSRIEFPPQTTNLHHEMEWVVALGGAGFEVDESAANNLVFGYACGLDLTRRDLQQKARETGKPWDLAKDFEHAAVISPIVPLEQTGIVDSGRIWLSVNGEIRQDGDLNQMIWSVPEIIAHLSRFYHLQAGDLIYTGTPEGVGPLQPGDQIEAAIEGVGTLSLSLNPC